LAKSYFSLNPDPFVTREILGPLVRGNFRSVGSIPSVHRLCEPDQLIYLNYPTHKNNSFTPLG